jgi:HPt (histidine-containing phosphotransfer) domain-containing protein
MSSKSKIEVDASLSDLIPTFLERKRGDLNSIVSNSRFGNYEAIATVAHRFIGEGGSFGIDAITEAGRKIEEAARAHQAKTVEMLALRLLTYLASIEIVYVTREE